MVPDCRDRWPMLSIEAESWPNGIESVAAAFGRHVDADWILTTGGTGPSPRDLTPEATAAYCDRLVPAWPSSAGNRSLEETPNAVFSRGMAGMKGTQYIVNCREASRPRSPRANPRAPLRARNRYGEREGALKASGPPFAPRPRPSPGARLFVRHGVDEGGSGR